MISLIDKFNQVSMLDMPDSIAKIYKDVPEINEIDNRGFPICRPLFSHSSLPFNFELEQIEVNNYDDDLDDIDKNSINKTLFEKIKTSKDEVFIQFLILYKKVNYKYYFIFISMFFNFVPNVICVFPNYFNHPD